MKYLKPGLRMSLIGMIMIGALAACNGSQNGRSPNNASKPPARTVTQSLQSQPAPPAASSNEPAAPVTPSTVEPAAPASNAKSGTGAQPDQAGDALEQALDDLAHDVNAVDTVADFK